MQKLVGAGALALCLVTAAHAADCKGQWMLSSWYGSESGNRTASGDFFDGSSMTAAMPSRTHLGERWMITYKGRSVTIKVNDVGPARWTHRQIDLSHAAAATIGLLPAGVAKVCGVLVK